MAHAGGRPSKFRKLVKVFLDHIQAGLTIEAAAARSGVTGRCVHYWLERGRVAPRGEFFQFFQDYTRARGEALASVIEEIRSAGREDWRATAWLAERMFKEALSLKQDPQTIVNVAQTAAALSRLTKEQQADLDRLYEGIQRRALARAMHELDGECGQPGA